MAARWAGPPEAFGFANSGTTNNSSSGFYLSNTVVDYHESMKRQ